jgi:beta-glucosidase
MELISQPIDFLGINFYKRGVTRHDPTAWPVRPAWCRQPQHAFTCSAGTGKCTRPRSPTCCLVRDRYGDMPVYITENGAAFYDPPVPLTARRRPAARALPA